MTSPGRWRPSAWASTCSAPVTRSSACRASRTTIGGEYCARSLDTLRAGGILVCLASPYDPPIEVVEAAAQSGVRTASPLAEPDRLALTAITELVAAGRLHPHIAEVLRLVDARRAHELGESSRTRGKTVLAVA
jgi:NADPH:quinone reductase-like Zn-dependent oxidoreductase